MQGLYSYEEVCQLINAGKKLILAGDEALLEKLPKGSWIAGTIPYFMGSDGGVFSKDLIFVNSISEYAEEVTIKLYDVKSLQSFPADGFVNGYTFIIIPGFSEALSFFAQNSAQFPGLFDRPVVGWVAGFDLADAGKTSAKVFGGETLEVSDSKAVVMQIKLPEGKTTNLDMVNIFAQGNSDVIKFTETGFLVKDCLINGELKNFADYVLEKNIDVKLPLVADYYGAMINTSFNSIDKENKTVLFYAPVFKDVEYKLAAPVPDYVAEFTKVATSKNINPVFSCNCILNYLYSELEGKKTLNITGPITFGEIAYQLLNQTLVYLTIEDM